MTDGNRLVIDVLDVSKAPKDLNGSLASGVFALAKDDRFSCQSPLVYALRASLIGEGLLLEGTASTKLHCSCDRCLKEYDVEIVVPDVCHFYEEIDYGGTLDVTDDVREDVVINFPAKCLCDDECKGICPQCGTNLNEETCDCPESSDGPSAWDGLDNLKL